MDTHESAGEKLQNLCFELAQEIGVEHAQLPIGIYMEEMKSRKVLTVNQVRLG